VLTVLKRGKRLVHASFELRFLIASANPAAAPGKIAISVPKRKLKSAVARNRIKRLVREEFRVHGAARIPLHMLVNYNALNDGRDASIRRLLRTELVNLLNEAIVRARVSNSGARAG
jgi:RNase P protein component